MNKVSISTWKKGLEKGLKTTWSLSKVIFPITIIVSILQYTPFIDVLTTILSPIMSIFGLSGDSAIVLVLGNVLNLYAAIGAILTLELTVKQVFILAVMLSLSHNIILETAITTKIGVKPSVIALLRIGLSFIFAIIINLTWHGGQEIARYGIVPSSSTALETWTQILTHAMQTAFIGVIQIMVIVIPIMIVIQLLKDINVLPVIANIISPITRLLGVSDKTAVTLVAGIIFGIAYGAGVIIQTAQEENLSKKDLYLVSIFLVSCHAVFEDTLIFLPLGINVLPLLLLRIFLAFIITAATARFWQSAARKTTP